MSSCDTCLRYLHFVLCANERTNVCECVMLGVMCMLRSQATYIINNKLQWKYLADGVVNFSHILRFSSKRNRPKCGSFSFHYLHASARANVIVKVFADRCVCLCVWYVPCAMHYFHSCSLCMFTSLGEKGDARQWTHPPFSTHLYIGHNFILFFFFLLFFVVVSIFDQSCWLQQPPTSTASAIEATSSVQPVYLCEWSDVIYYPLGIYFEISLKAPCENCFHSFSVIGCYRGRVPCAENARWNRFQALAYACLASARSHEKCGKRSSQTRHGMALTLLAI